ncbi:MAG: hypothetical protein K6E57_09970 [Fibrobacter sp.]|nr:hypothetical protein [Fibrobacter sp.]
MSGRTELLHGSDRGLGLFDDDDDSPGNSAFGHETACSHGHHKWFCD